MRMPSEHTARKHYTFSDFVGQNKLKDTLKIMINSARVRKTSMDHLLFYGPPGLGKTTLAKIIANELNTRIHYSQGSLICKKSDVLSLFSSIGEGDVIFIDEIHSINKSVEELLYSAMEYFVIDVPIGVEGEQKIMRMKLRNFTLIGATTKINQITGPLRDRFGLLGKLNFYNHNEIRQIIINNSAELDIPIEEKAVDMIAEYSKFTPRICIHLLKRAWDFAIFEAKNEIDCGIIQKTLSNLGINAMGLSTAQIEYLCCLQKVFRGDWASLDALSSVLSEDKNIIISSIEADLLYFQLIEKSPRGRRITKEGITYLKRNVGNKKNGEIAKF